MKEFKAEKIRNVVVAGHGGEGKTTLVEAMLFNSGVIDRMGKVEEGNTTSDYDPEEIKRHISINAAVAPVETGDIKINILDAPGYFDFQGELTQVMKPADGAVIVVGAVSGLTVGAEKAWSLCSKNGVSKMILINQMDRENANYFRVLDQLKAKYGTSVAPVSFPIMKGSTFTGLVDLIEMKARIFAGKETKEADIPAELADQAATDRKSVV
jgi:elongation factor G